jgi:hypothetical protein
VVLPDLSGLRLRRKRTHGGPMKSRSGNPTIIRAMIGAAIITEMCSGDMFSPGLAELIVIVDTPSFHPFFPPF